MLTRQAVVLVGGKGTRLGALTKLTPKPLMPLDDDCVFLDEVLFEIARHGFDDIVLAAGHLGEQFSARYAGKRLRGAGLRVVVEPAPAGTGGALRSVAPLLDPTFLFINGDTVFDINLRCLDALLMHDKKALAALALRRVPDASRYGSVGLDGSHIRFFQEKRPQGDEQSGLINGGIGLFRREIIDYVAALPCSMELEVYPRLAEAGRLLGAEFSGYFVDIGLPETLARARADLRWRRRRPAVFFDRDGVLNHDKGYTHRVQDLRLIPGAIEAVRAVNDMGALAFVVTNQAGVAHGFYLPEDVARFHAALAEELARGGAHIDAFFNCFHHPRASVDTYRHDNHPDRKPNPGMIFKALGEWPVDSDACLMIGDMLSDIEAARRAGIAEAHFTGGDLAVFAAPHLAALAARSTLV